MISVLNLYYYAGMGECEFINKCPFFNTISGDETSIIDDLKEKYCRTNNLNCARYMISMAVGAEAVPEDLYPNQKDRAYEIISGS